ncbi:hypothetical protein VP501E541_P0018 [Vibrio phage 501E54-1]|nr:hypothetical protein VP501E541_P0018 [Vibrio phage 501E54-1]
MNRGLKSQVEYYIPDEDFQRSFAKQFNRDLVEKLNKKLPSFRITHYTIGGDKELMIKLASQLIRYYQLEEDFVIKDDFEDDMFDAKLILTFYKKEK